MADLYVCPDCGHTSPDADAFVRHCMGSLAIMPKIQGFTIAPATAWWVTCDRCEESELVFGHGADQAALAWATEHHHEHEESDRG